MENSVWPILNVQSTLYYFYICSVIRTHKALGEGWSPSSSRQEGQQKVSSLWWRDQWPPGKSGPGGLQWLLRERVTTCKAWCPGMGEQGHHKWYRLWFKDARLLSVDKLSQFQRCTARCTGDHLQYRWDGWEGLKLLVYVLKAESELCVSALVQFLFQPVSFLIIQLPLVLCLLLILGYLLQRKEES